MSERGRQTGLTSERPYSETQIRWVSQRFAESFQQQHLSEINLRLGEANNYSTEGLRQRSETLQTTPTPENSLDSAFSEFTALFMRSCELTFKDKPTPADLLAAYAMFNGTVAEVELDGNREIALAVTATAKILSGHDVHILEQSGYINPHEKVLQAIQKMGPVYHTLGIQAAILIKGKYFIYDPEFTEKSPAGEYLREIDIEDLSENPSVIYGTRDTFVNQALQGRAATLLRSDYTEPPSKRTVDALVNDVSDVLVDEAISPVVNGIRVQPDSEYLGILHTANDIAVDLTTLHTQKPVIQGITDQTKTGFAVDLTPLGETRVSEILKKSGQDTPVMRRAVLNALQAHVIYANTDEAQVYEVKDHRIYPPFPSGIQEALEVKEGIEVTPITRHLSQITIQNYMKRYESIGGIDTAVVPHVKELHDVYGIETLQIPRFSTKGEILLTHRRDLSQSIYVVTKGVEKQVGGKTITVKEVDHEATQQAKLTDIVESTKRIHAVEDGRPIIISATSRNEAIQIGKMLKQQDIAFDIYTPKSQVTLSQMGEPGKITIIPLAGVLDLPLPQTQNDKPVHVIATSRLSPIIDERVFKLAGSDGTIEFFVALSDPFFQDYFKHSEGAEKRIYEILRRVNQHGNRFITSPEAVALAVRTTASDMSNNSRKWREYLVKYDDVVQAQWEEFMQRRQELIDHPEITQHKLVDRLAQSAVRQIREALNDKSKDRGRNLERILQLIGVDADERADLMNPKIDHDKAIRAIVTRRMQIFKDHPGLLQQLELSIRERAWTELLTDLNGQNQRLWIRQAGRDIPLEDPQTMARRLSREKEKTIHAALVQGALSLQEEMVTPTEPLTPQQIIAQLRLDAQTDSTLRKSGGLFSKWGRNSRLSLGTSIAFTIPTVGGLVATLLLTPMGWITLAAIGGAVGITGGRALTTLSAYLNDQELRRIRDLRNIPNY